MLRRQQKAGGCGGVPDDSQLLTAPFFWHHLLGLGRQRQNHWVSLERDTQQPIRSAVVQRGDRAKAEGSKALPPPSGRHFQNFNPARFLLGSSIRL